MYDIRTFSGFPRFKKRFLLELPKDYQLPENKDNCWEWQGSMNKSTGYGRLGWGRENRYDAHRISYIVFKGLIPEGKIVRHTCDNRSCVNPNHLILGTYHDNSVDSVKRNRQGHQKLNEECVKVIKWMLKYQYVPGLRNKLAELHNVTKTTICDVENKKTWAWVQI